MNVRHEHAHERTQLCAHDTLDRASRLHFFLKWLRHFSWAVAVDSKGSLMVLFCLVTEFLALALS